MFFGLGLSLTSRRRGAPPAPDYVEPVGDDPVAPPAGDPVPPTTTPTDPETDEPEPGFDPDFVNLDRIEVIDGQAAERTTNDPATFGTAYIASEVSAGEYWEFEVKAPTPKNATFAVGVTTLAMPLNGIPGERATELAWWSDGTVRQNGATLIDLGADGRLARGDRGAIAFGPSGEVRLYKNCTVLNAGAAVGSLVTADAVFPFVALFSARTRIDMVFTLAKFGCPVPEGYYPIGQVPVAPGYRYWRILSNTAWGVSGTGVRYKEIAMRLDTYGVDSATSANAIGSTPDTGTVANGFDNDYASEVKFPRPDINTVWIGQDFGSPVTVKRIEIRQAATERPRSVTIQGSNDLSTWETQAGPLEVPDTSRGSIIDVGTPDAQPTTFPIWVVHVDTNWFSATGGVQFAEIEMRATVSGADQTTTGNAIAGVSPLSGTLANAFDNATGTSVRLPRQDLDANHVYIGQNFGALTGVAEMVITGTTVERPKAINILVSVDGIAFEPYAGNSFELANQTANTITLASP